MPLTLAEKLSLVRRNERGGLYDFFRNRFLFPILDDRGRTLDLPVERVRTIAHRQLGVGCDQLIVLEQPTERGSDVFMRIYNPDGSEAGACGNATRCVASLLMGERKSDQVTVQTISGLLESHKAGKGLIAVDMGPARTGWRAAIQCASSGASAWPE
mgnify:CR=1 FL=1